MKQNTVEAASAKALFAGVPPIVAVLHVENVSDAAPLARALARGGIRLLEVTLRSLAATEVISVMRAAAPDAIVGAGTITTPDQLQAVRDVGAQFAVSPALTPNLAAAAGAIGIPFIAGAITPSEMLRARELGFKELKFFPADLAGGTKMLRHVLPLFPDLTFCPTGGISDDNLRDYLDQPNCFAAGGIWMANREMIEKQDWATIEEKSRRSVAVLDRL